MKEEGRIMKEEGRRTARRAAATMAAVMAVALLLSGCGTAGTTNILQNPVVQSTITLLEQEAAQLLADYIKAHLGASKASSRAKLAVKSQLAARHPEASAAEINAAVEKASRK